VPRRYRKLASSNMTPAVLQRNQPVASKRPRHSLLTRDLAETTGLR